MSDEGIARSSFGVQEPTKMIGHDGRHHRLDDCFLRSATQQAIVTQNRKHIPGEFLARRVAPTPDFGMRRLALVKKSLDIGADQGMVTALPARNDDLLYEVIQQPILSDDME